MHVRTDHAADDRVCAHTGASLTMPYYEAFKGTPMGSAMARLEQCGLRLHQERHVVVGDKRLEGS